MFRVDDPSIQIERILSIITEIKKTVTSSHDVISRVNMPNLFIDEFDRYVQLFGEVALKDYIEKMTVLELVREHAYSLKDSHMSKLAYPLSTALIAITMQGVGECQELSNRMVYELAKAGYKNQATVISLCDARSKEAIPFLHALVILGDCPALKPGMPLSAFSDLTSDSLFIDAFLGRVGLVNQLPELLKDYNDANSLNSIFNLSSLSLSAVDVRRFDQDVKFFNGLLLRRMAVSTFIPPKATIAMSAFQAATNPVLKLHLSLIKACPETSQGDSIKEALKAQDYNLVMRRAAAYSIAPLIDLLLLNKELLPTLNINSTSSNGMTVLDWAIKAGKDSSLNDNLIMTLVKHGAKTAKELKSIPAQTLVQ